MNKRNYIKMLTTLLLVASMVLLLTACGGGKPNGTYVSKGLVPQTYTFKGDQVTMSAFGINATGTYSISNGKLNIEYTLLGMTQSISYSFEQKGNTLFIQGTEFVKQ